MYRPTQSRDASGGDHKNTLTQRSATAKHQPRLAHRQGAHPVPHAATVRAVCYRGCASSSHMRSLALFFVEGVALSRNDDALIRPCEEQAAHVPRYRKRAPQRLGTCERGSPNVESHAARLILFHHLMRTRFRSVHRCPPRATVVNVECHRLIARLAYVLPGTE